MPRNNGINKRYTHFAVNKETGKIVDGWEYSSIDNASIRYYYKLDMKDNDRKLNEHSLLTGKYLISKGIDPYNPTNWGNN